MAVDQLEHLAGGRGGVVGAEVERAVFGGASDDVEAGPLVGGVYAERQVGFVVAEHDVEARFVLLDQRVLKDLCLLGIEGDDDLEIAEEVVEVLDEVPGVVAGEVAADAGAELGRLADVDDAPLVVAHDVDAGLAR